MKEAHITATSAELALERFTTFGDLLKYLRRRAGLTQRELSIAVGYSDAQISRLEQNQRLPDIPTITARFVPALDLGDQPQVIRRLVDLAATVRREDAPATGLPPFKGLLPFDEADADLYFGREAMVAKLAARIMALGAPGTEAAPDGSAQSLRFLAVVGASGSGKSSLVRAGLVPALRWDPRSANWPVHIITPTAHPLEALAASFGPPARSAASTAGLARELGRDPLGLQRQLAQTMSAAPPTTRLLLVVDQFEELFTLCGDEAEWRGFVHTLLAAARAPAGPAVVVLTLRADFYAHCADFPELREALAEHQEYIGTMSGAELRRAIEKPAQRGNWEFEPGLVDTLLQDLGVDGRRSPEPGALPLLSHALLETWQRRRGHTLTLSGYTAAGGVRGAIAETAEAVFNDQLNPQQRTMARHIFLRLTELGEDEAAPDTRRRVSLDELVLRPAEAPAVREVLTLLADARLITTEKDTAEVAHEALIREWPTLRQWLAENRASLRLHRHLTEAAQEWERLQRDEAALYRGARLAQAQEWAGLHPADLNTLEREFLEASRALVERETSERDAQRQRELEAAQKLAVTEKLHAADQGRAAQRLRRRALYLAGALVMALLMAGAALFFGEQARQAASAAQASERVALARELAAAAVSNLELDSQRSLLLALEAVSVTYAVDQTWTAEAEDALRRTVLAARPALILRGHSAEVVAVAFSPDGTRLASFGDDGAAIVWDAATGQALLTIATGADIGSNGLAFSPDGARLATAGPPGTAVLWDAVTGRAVQTLSGHADLVVDLAFSPDGTRLATASEDKSAKIWDLASETVMLTLSGHAAEVWGVAFSPDGEWVATASGDGTTRLWEANTGQLVHTLVGHTGTVYKLAFSPQCAPRPVGLALGCDLRLATVGADGTARVWDVATGTEAFPLDGNLRILGGVAFSPDGLRLATTAFDGKARVWDAMTGRQLFTLVGHTGPVTGVSFSPECAPPQTAVPPPCGARLATGSFDGTVRIWDLVHSQELLTLALPGHTSAALSPACALPPEAPDEPCAVRLALGFLDGTVQVWDVSGAFSGEAVARQVAFTLSGHAGAIYGLAFSADGTRLAAASADQTASVWDLGTRQQLFVLRGHTDEVWTVAFSPVCADAPARPAEGCGERLVTTGRDQTVRVWDAATGAELFDLPIADGANGVAFTPPCAAEAQPCPPRLATANDSGTAKLWDLSTGQELLAFSGFRDWSMWQDLRPQTTSQQLRVLSGRPEAVLGVAFNADGSRLATANADGTAKLWDVQTGETLATFFGHTNAVLGVAFGPRCASAPAAQPCRQRVTTASLDGTIKLWDAETGEALLTLSGHTGAVRSLAYTPDGTRLMTDSNDGTVRFYLVRMADLLALARAQVTRALTVTECQQYLHQPACPGQP